MNKSIILFTLKKFLHRFIYFYEHIAAFVFMGKCENFTPIKHSL